MYLSIAILFDGRVERERWEWLVQHHDQEHEEVNELSQRGIADAY